MTFFMLNVNDFFGGGVLLLKNHREEQINEDGRTQKQEDFGTLSVVSISYSDLFLDRRLC